MWTCKKCGENVEDSCDKCLTCGSNSDEIAIVADTSDGGEGGIMHGANTEVRRGGTVGSSRHTGALASRYRDAYAVARATIAQGNFIKVMGAVVGIAIVVIAAVLGSQLRGKTMAIMGAVAGLVLGGQMYFLGVLICAQGQTLLAAVDTAVNTCSFLSREARWSILGMN